MDGRKRILVVDDEQAVLLVLSYSLRLYGDTYQVVTAASGEEALDVAKGVPLGLLVTDIRMRGMDGVVLTRAIREINPGVPVIWITAHGKDQLRTDAEALSVYASLDKPLEVAEFRRVVGEALASRPDGSSPDGKGPTV